MARIESRLGGWRICPPVRRFSPEIPDDALARRAFCIELLQQRPGASASGLDTAPCLVVGASLAHLENERLHGVRWNKLSELVPLDGKLLGR
jgi:hypothetical protein